jgi:hypothetical protein
MEPLFKLNDCVRVKGTPFCWVVKKIERYQGLKYPTPYYMYTIGDGDHTEVHPEDRLELFSEDVKQQPHYTQFKIQPITFIIANNLSYNQGNVIKYVCRYKSKNGLEDLEKAKNYIDYLIQELKTGEVKP